MKIINVIYGIYFIQYTVIDYSNFAYKIIRITCKTHLCNKEKITITKRTYQLNFFKTKYLNKYKENPFTKKEKSLICSHRLYCKAYQTISDNNEICNMSNNCNQFIGDI